MYIHSKYSIYIYTLYIYIYVLCFFYIYIWIHSCVYYQFQGIYQEYRDNSLLETYVNDRFKYVIVRSYVALYAMLNYDGVMIKTGFSANQHDPFFWINCWDKKQRCLRYWIPTRGNIQLAKYGFVQQDFYPSTALFVAPGTTFFSNPERSNFDGPRKVGDPAFKNVFRTSRGIAWRSSGDSEVTLSHWKHCRFPPKQPSEHGPVFTTTSCLTVDGTRAVQKTGQTGSSNAMRQRSRQVS